MSDFQRQGDKGDGEPTGAESTARCLVDGLRLSHLRNSVLGPWSLRAGASPVFGLVGWETVGHANSVCIRTLIQKF